VLGILESLLSRIPGKVCVNRLTEEKQENRFYLQYASHPSTQQLVLEVLHGVALRLLGSIKLHGKDLRYQHKGG